MLCQHTGQRPLRGAALQGRRGLKGRETVRIVAGVLLDLAGQQHSATVCLLFKYLFEFVLCDSGHHPFLNFDMKKRHPFEWRKVKVLYLTA